MPSVRAIAYLVTMTLALLLVGAGLLAAAGAKTTAVQAAPANAAVPAAVTLAHYAPFGDTPLSTSLTIRIENDQVVTEVTDFLFSHKVTGLALPAGAYTVTLTPTGVLTPVLSATRSLSEGRDYSLSVIGGINGWPLDLRLLPIQTTPATATAQVRFTHMSPFTTSLPATAVDVCTHAGASLPSLADLIYGQSTPYVALPPGLHDLKVAVAGSNCAALVLDVPPMQLAAGQIADVFVIGLPTVPELPLQVDAMGMASRASWGHFAPFADTVTRTAVSVRVADSDLITDFVYPQLTPYIELPLGQHLVEIIPTNAITPVLTGTAVISGYVDYTFAFIGDALNQPLAFIRLLDDNVTPPPEGEGRLRLSHLAPVAPNLAGTRIDLCNTADKSILANDLAYRETSVLSLPADIYQVYVSIGFVNCQLPLLDVPPFAIRDGRVAYAYAIGNLNLHPPSLTVTPNLTPSYLYLPYAERQ